MHDHIDAIVLRLCRLGLPSAAEKSVYSQRHLLLHLFVASLRDVSDLDCASLELAIRESYAPETGAFGGDIGLTSSIVMTHCAIHVLERLDRLGGALKTWLDGNLVAFFIVSCQRVAGLWRGGFAATPLGGECDLRCTLSALLCTTLLRRHGVADRVDRVSAMEFICRCFRSSEGAFGGTPTDTEAHCGMTFCAIASLRLLDGTMFLNSIRRRLIRYCVSRQNSNPWHCDGDGDCNEGLQGRPNKPCDTCYTFWICGALSLLPCDSADTLNTSMLLRFVESCTSAQGVAKTEEHEPDPVHTVLGSCGVLVSRKQFDPLWMTHTLE